MIIGTSEVFEVGKRYEHSILGPNQVVPFFVLRVSNYEEWKNQDKEMQPTWNYDDLDSLIRGFNFYEVSFD